VLAKNLTILKH